MIATIYAAIEVIVVLVAFVSIVAAAVRRPLGRCRHA